MWYINIFFGQFSLFAALIGHNDTIKETTRLTDSRIELDENIKLELNERIVFLQDNITSRPIVSITYFKPDNKKSGGT